MGRAGNGRRAGMGRRAGTGHAVASGLVGLVAAILVAGCASAIGGTAEPVPGASIASSGLVTAGTAQSSGTAQPSDPAGTSGTTGTPSAPQTSGSGPGSTTGSTPGTSDSSTGSPGSAVEPGTSTSGQSSAQSSAGPGSYPSTPLSVPATPQTATGVTLLESRRLAGVVVPPTLIDPQLSRLAALSSLPFKNAAAIRQLLLAPADVVAQRAGLLAGFSSSRSSPDRKSAMVVAMMEFDGTKAAEEAAASLTAAAADKKQDTGKASIPGFPAASGWVGRSNDGTTTSARLHAFLPQGSLVVYVWVKVPVADSGRLVNLVKSAFSVESATARKFTRTPKAELDKQPSDRDGLRARTLPNSGDNLSVVDGLYTAAGELNYDSDPVQTKKVFDSAGVDLVSLGRANLYRAKDAAGAAAVRDAFIVESSAQGSEWTDYAYQGKVPGARCVQQPLNSIFYCMATRDRYAIEVNAASESDLDAQLAAQYALLGTF